MTEQNSNLIEETKSFLNYAIENRMELDKQEHEKYVKDNKKAKKENNTLKTQLRIKTRNESFNHGVTSKKMKTT